MSLPVKVECERCGCLGLSDVDMTSRGDPDLPAVIPAPVGWLPCAEDPDLYVCGDCATNEEITDHMADEEYVNAVLWGEEET